MKKQYRSDALETGDAVYIAKAMGVAARAKGKTEIASETHSQSAGPQTQ